MRPVQRNLFGDPAPRRAASGPRRPGPAVPDGALAALAERLPGGLRLGTSSWSFPGWEGIVYDGSYAKPALSRDGLRAYARHPLLRAAGIDRGYYGPISAKTYRTYAGQVPDGFRFLVKAQDVCTLPRFPAMPRYGAQAGRDNPLFLDAPYATGEVVGPYVEGLGERAGVLLFQFSPMDADSHGEPERFVDRLYAFLSALPDGPLYAVELRTRVLFGRDYLLALQDARAVHCLNVHPSMPPLERQAGLVVETERETEREPAPRVVRWMLHSGLSYRRAVERYEPFDRIVDEDPAARAAIADLARAALAAGRPVTVIANNKAEGSAPLSVFGLAREIAG